MDMPVARLGRASDKPGATPLALQVYGCGAGVSYPASGTVQWQDYDRDGIDLRIQAGGYLRPSIGLQLKATIGLGNPNSDGNYRFPLPRGNYDWLIAPSQVLRYLVVLGLPEHRADWLAVSAESLVLRECCYWVSLEGLPETRNSVSVTVSIPGGNIFDSDALVTLIERSRQGL